MELDNIKLQTTWNDAAGSINNNFSKIKQAIAALEVGGGGLNEDQLADYLLANGYVTDTQLAQRLASYATTIFVESEAKKAQAAAEQYIQDEVLTDYATTKYVEEREVYLEGYTEEWVTELENDIKTNPSSYITLKTINNQSLFGSGNIDVKTTVEWSDIVGRPTNLSEFTNDMGYITEVTKKMIMDATDAVNNGGKVLVSTAGDLAWMAYPRNLSDLTDDVVAGHYLPLTGGTINSNTFDILTLDTSYPHGDARIHLKVNGESKSLFGWSSVYGTMIYNTVNGLSLSIKDDGTPLFNNNTIIHSGNIGSYAMPLAGGTMGGHIVMGKNAIVFNPYQSETWENPQNSGLRILNTVGVSATEALSSYSVGLSVSGYYGFQLASDAGIGAFYYRNTVTGTKGSWKLIAFTDSDITGNAATATRARYIETLDYNGHGWYGDNYKVFAQWTGDTVVEWQAGDGYETRVDRAKKLDTPRTIWGQSFDGTGNVDGDLSGFTSLIMYGSTYGIYKGSNFSSLPPENSLVYYAISHYFHCDNGSYSMILNSYGNVGIGTSAPAYKLDVNGVAYATYGLSASSVSINRNPSTGRILNTSLSALKIEAYASDVRVNVYKPTAAAATALTIFNNGSLGVGTTSYNNYLLDVAGTGRFTGLASFDAGVKIGSTTLGYTNLGLSIDTSLYPSVSDSLSLGHSSQRWFSIYARKAYTEEVKIGDAILSWDTASQALKVDKPFYSTSQVSSGAKAVEAKAVIAPLALLKFPSASTTTEYTDEQIASQYGLTSEVLDNLARGIYTRVTITYIGTPYVWDYEMYFPYGGNKTLVLRNNLASSFKFERNATTGKWKITNA